MPNPRANRPLTLDQVTADLKSFAQPAQALFDMMAGALRGSAVATAGLPGDLETLGRMGLNAAGGAFNPAMPSRSGRAFQPVSEEPYFPSSEELAKRFPPTIPNGDPVRRKSAEPFEELGQFAPLPMSGKALKVLPYALGRGTGEVTKEAARMVNDAMIHQTGPLSQGPLSMLAPKGAVSHVFEPNPNWKTNTVNFGKPTPGIMIPSKMSNVREAVRDLKGNYGARRVERAADEIPNLERMFKEDALKQAFTGDNASAMITLSPAEFERYAIELSKRHDIGPKMAQLAKEGNIDKYTVPTDEYIQYLQRLNEGFSDVPYLSLSKDEVGLPTMPRVIGHEGRHRSRALAEQGAPTSLVQINPRGDLREGMPRRTQEEFIEALKEELERSNRLVLPEKDGEYRRPAIELPEPYAEGGSVNMAAGGLLKGIKAARKGALNAERSMPARGALSFADEPVGGPSVIKEKGGNWMSGSAEKAVGPLLQKGMINNREIPYGPEFDVAIRQRIEDLKQAASQPGYQGGAGRVAEHLERNLENPRVNEAAINKWVQSNLTNYIKKEMATPEDPVRRLAEEGIVHIPSEQVGTNRYKAPDRRATMGGEQLGQSDAAKAWEDASDVSLRASRIRDLSGDYKEPWMANADPSTKIYSPGREMDALGFDHIVDVLREDLAAGRIRPEQLSKVSMEQAVRRTYEYDQEKARKIAEAQIKITEGMPVHKEYPEGYKWIELNQPKDLPEGWKESAVVGTYYDEAGNFQRHPREKILEDALKYEGDTMGHCVGGYCPDVLEGRKRIYSLRDAKGEPHVTIEVQPMRGSELGRYAADLPEGEDVATMKNPPLKIVQIKGKGNRAPKEEYLPFVQDFVKGGKWSDVGDLSNAGLRDVKFMTNPDVYEKYLERGLTVPKYATEKELDELHNEYLRFAEPQNYKPPEDGMKHGGSVHISDNPDTMMMEVGDKHMKGGGAEDDTKAFIGYPKLAKQARYARAVAPERGDVNLLKDPQTYAFIMGMLGEAPDELGFTALDSDEQKQKIKAAGEKGFVTGAATQLGPLAQLGKKAGKKILSLAGEGINERMLSGRSLTPFIDTPAPAMFAVPPGDLKSIQAAGRASHQEQAATRAAIDAEIAEQMAKLPARSRKANEAMGLYHPVGGGIKLSKPTRGMHSTTVADPKFNPPEIGIITPEQLVKEEAALFPLVGDRAAGGRYLTHVGENELEVPVRLTAGPRYMDANYNRRNPDESAAWESGLGRVTALGRQAQRAGEGGRPVYGIYTAGSATNTDFNAMGANALIQQIPFGKITKKAEKEFDRAMKMGTQEFPAIPNWPGIRSPEARAMLLDKSNGIVRTKLFGTMGKENFQSMGFPDVPTTRKAIIEPELLDIPTNQAGFRLAKMDTTGRIIENPNIPSDYPAAMAGKVAGKLDVPADYKDIFQSHFDARRLLSQPESGDYYSFSRAHPIQYADEQWLNRLMEQRLANERKIKEGEYKKGGEIIVKPKKDGQKFKPGKKPDQILKHGQAMPRGKDPEVDIGQMAPMMMAGGGEVNADDLILEERRL